ncbi:uracil-DNA glycosylase family protein [Xylophilus sp.]|uniref:uracil-DNA glycosylase family protein n=1 Tax=Xylophilus sp. TaxID=2653893 RepID=UPI0013B7258A|nr:uracil-DNA glycosylase family protein [Xylophilus sp.]KAF1046288.1 MAG: hypothetical protein GAK38_02528 [Xylophilus sp.]
MPGPDARAELEAARTCAHCAPSLPLGPRPVFQLHPAARILIASQAPGRKVHETGIPFNDASGDRLRDWLGVGRDEFYRPELFAIVPMGLCYPGRGPSGDRPPRPECAPLRRAGLLGLLGNLELTLVVGQYAVAYHLPEETGGVTEAVRHWRSTLPAALALPHPSPRNNGWLARNPWFGTELLPVLRARVAAALGRG